MGKPMQSHENLLTPAQAVVLLACRSYFGVLSFIDVKAIQSIATQLPVNLAAGEPNRRRKNALGSFPQILGPPEFDLDLTWLGHCRIRSVNGSVSSRRAVPIKDEGRHERRGALPHLHGIGRRPRWLLARPRPRDPLLPPPSAVISNRVALG